MPHRAKLLQVAPLVGASVLILSVNASVAAAQSTTAGQPGTWTAAPGSASDTTDYSGSIDTPSAGATVPASGSFNVNGWFVDKTAQGWAGADDVQVFLGQMGNGG